MTRTRLKQKRPVKNLKADFTSLLRKTRLFSRVFFVIVVRMTYMKLYAWGFALFTLVICTSLPSFAQEMTATPRHGVAMHGDVKYGPDFAHFDYANPEAPKGGTLKLGTVGSFDSLHPFIIKGSSAAGLSFLGNSHLYESLMEQSYDEPFSMYGLLAESIELPEDRSWVAFNLRPQATWHDGKPITSEDVVWTFNTLLEKGTPFYKAYYGDVKEVKATSETRILFTFNNTTNAELPLIISQLPVLPKHYWDTEERDFGKTTLEPPLGSGPYKITDVSPGRSVTYTRAENWWGKDLPLNSGRYNFESIQYDYYRDDNVALEAFLSGEFDIREENTAKLWQTAYDATPVNDGRIVKETIENGRPSGMQAFAYNLRRPIFQDIAVRKALAYAFDFEWSNKQFAFGSYKRTDSYFENSELASSGLPEGRELEILEQFKDQLPERVFTETYHPPVTDGSGNARANLRKAAQILDKSGYKLNADGVRTHEETGQELRFEIVDSNPVFERWTLPFIRNLKRIGVIANFRAVDSAQYQNRMNSFDYDMTILSLPQSSSPGNEQRDYWLSSNADIEGSRNYMGIKDPVIDQLIAMIIDAPSREELVHRTRALDRVLLSGYYVIPQWHFNKWRLAYWTKLEHPDTLSPLSPNITSTWWNRNK